MKKKTKSNTCFLWFMCHKERCNTCFCYDKYKKKADKKIRKDKVKAIKEKMRLEAYQCGLKGEVKDKYRVAFCPEAQEWVCQVYINDKTEKGWLCLHD